MKKYKITELGETSEYKKDQIITERDIPIYWIELGIKIGCIEEVKEEGKRWRAEKDEVYYFLTSPGIIDNLKETNHEYDNFRYSIGNYFQTPEQAQQKKDRDLAIARVNDRIRELQGGEMSMEEMMDIKIQKGEIYYSVYNKKYDYDGIRNYFLNILLPMGTGETAEQIIKEHKNDLDIIGGIKD